MKQKFLGWTEVVDRLWVMASPSSELIPSLNHGQRASLVEIAERIHSNGVIVADEVGMGKTRIAAVLTRAVIEAGGRVAILVPPGLGFQWGDELRKIGVSNVPPLLRSLGAYLDAWNENEHVHEPWAEQPALMISQAFCNWQVKSTTRMNWKWTLLPKTLALVQAKLRQSGRMPRGTSSNEKFDDKRVDAAAAWIAGNADEVALESLATEDKFSQWGRESPLFKPENYLKQTRFREGLESVVGLGLGEFDLLVIDEAHKSRGAESNLNRLLERVIAPSWTSRRLALTATPIELDVSQWDSTLERLGTTEAQRTPIVEATKVYAEAIRRLRLGWRTSSEVRDNYRKAAEQFKKVLSPYLLRRDKREDEDVLKFKEASGRSEYDYRCLREVAVDFKDLSPVWRHVVCAAEALSVVREPLPALDGRAKRLRLTVGNGHGLASVIDEAFRDDKEDKRQIEEELAQAEDKDGKFGFNARQPAAPRSAWWVSTLQGALANDPDILFDHPAILAAVRIIEEEVDRGEKVLVFGRFTRPMRALVNLLNARQMLRIVEPLSELPSQRPWPQRKVHGEEWPAVCAAHRQLKSTVDLDLLDDLLARRYRQESGQRARQRELLLGRLRAGLAEVEGASKSRAILEAVERQAMPVTGEAEDDDRHVALLARAIAANTDHPDASDADLAKAFRALVEAAGDHDSGEEEFDDEQAEEAWHTLEEHLREGYTSQQGGFARLMYGETKLQVRRMIQLAFNRPNSSPRVLVAQSLVGREGLNLHESCRIVVLLHPEWNPGVVEQQIGRVDRVNSRWAKMLQNAIANGISGADLPRIEIRPIVFKGTYDEHNWKVLQERWDDLRAQLHGEAIPLRLRASEDAEGHAILDQIDAARPNFSPRKK